MIDIARVFAEAGQRIIVVPRPHPELVTKRVLVMERLAGFTYQDVEAMKTAGIDTTAMVRALIISFLEGAMIFGVFHGDLHGGNLFVMPEGKIALFDYGITARMDETRRLAFMRLMMLGAVNDVRGQLEAYRDLGALRADINIDKVIRDLKLDKPPVDPTEMSSEQLTREIQQVTKALLGYGAKLPKPLMLFVKNMLFIDDAIATITDVDILGEILAVVTYFTERHGEQIAREVGVELLGTPIDLDGYRAAMGFPDETDPITFQDLQERRERIRRRLQERTEPPRRRSFVRAVYRVVRRRGA